MYSIVFYFLIFLIFSSCVSNKTPYDPVQANSQLKQSERNIAYLKNISKIEDNNYDFISNQMQILIRNYKRMKTHLSNIEDKLDDTLKKIDSFRYKKLLEAKAPSQSIEDEIRITNKDNEQVILSISQLDDYKSIIGELIVGDYNTSEEETQRALKLLKDKLARSQGKPIETKNPTDEGETPEAELEPKEEIEETFEEDSLIDEPITDEVNLFSEIENQEENKASFLLGKQLFENESYEMALAELQKYRNDNPEGRHYLEATFYIGQAFKKLKMPIEAKIFFQEIIKTNADSRWAMKVKKEMTE